MMRDSHDEAQRLFALGREASDAEQRWLSDHLEQCAACREYAEAAGRAIAALRSIPLAADSRLVRATKMRVRFHASRLRETRERMWLVAMACIGVGLSAVPSTLFLWRLFSWMGEWAGFSRPTWQTGFVIFCVGPVLVVSAVLLVRGTHFTSRNEPWK